MIWVRESLFEIPAASSESTYTWRFPKSLGSTVHGSILGGE